MTRALLLLRKDLLVLRRSPLLGVLLVVYPLLVAALVGVVGAYANAKPRVAFVDDDGLPASVSIGGETFDIDALIARAAKDVTLVRLSRGEAERELRNGRVVAVVRVPPGFVAQLKAMVESPRLELETTRGVLASRTTQQMQALVYNLNRRLQEAFIRTNLHYVQLILRGGSAEFLGRRVDVLGLQRTQQLLETAGTGGAIDQVRDFVGVAELALAQTGAALRATANPVELDATTGSGRSSSLSARLQAYALALVAGFLAIVLASGALAAERDDGVLARLARGPAPPGAVLAAKVALAAVTAALVGACVAVVGGVAIDVVDAGAEPWARVPALMPALAVVGAAMGALGALVATLARDARSAVLASVLVVLPVALLGFVPREVAPAAGWVSDLFPFAHAVRLFDALLYELDPWPTVLVEVAWLAALAAAFAAAARLLMRRLLV